MLVMSDSSAESVQSEQEHAEIAVGSALQAAGLAFSKDLMDLICFPFDNTKEGGVV